MKRTAGRSPNPLPSLLLSLLLTGVLPGVAEAQDREFPVGPDVERIVVRGVSGDVEIRPANGNPRIELSADVRPAGAFRAGMSNEGGTLTFEEE